MDRADILEPELLLKSLGLLATCKVKKGRYGSVKKFIWAAVAAQW